MQKSSAWLLVYLFTYYINSANAGDVSNFANMYDEDGETYCDTIKDPLESFNRTMFKFNAVLDTAFAKPTSKIYNSLFHPKIRQSITNIFDNLYEPNSIVNNLLQGKVFKSLSSFWRLAINSTLGVGGIVDVASKIGLSSNKATFGDALAHYGVPPGPYLILPLLGPSSVRDFGQQPIVLFSFFNPIYRNMDLTLYTGLTTLDLINLRLNASGLFDYLSTSTDPYVALRSMYWQKRQNEVQYPKYSKCYKRGN